MLELDEVLTFVARKQAQLRIWIALERTSRQVVAFHIGDGTMDSCKRLWRKLSWGYQRSHSVSDLWRSYSCLLDHEQVGKGTG